ncbi:hypothetical protein [Marinomonas sp. MED121]|uniref:hypothetical protein n=1 Tax=Marinomonas sp. MED121 TaxID=314277 RepID=UPI0003181084|nr:hypothetical protein [Marinomonas sp. MED121]
MIKGVVFGVLLCLISACSKKDLYENIQANNQFACNNVAASQYDECMQRSSMSYEEYEAKRTEDPYESNLGY